MAAGRGVWPPYYVASRLVLCALDNWNTFHGWCLARGIKPLKLTISEFQDLVLFWLTDGITEESLMDLERKLTLPPAMHKIKADDPVWGRDAEMAMFKKAMKPKTQ